MTDPGSPGWGTTDPRFRRWERTVRIGRGEAAWARAARAVLRWEVKTRSGFRVAPAGRVVPGLRAVVTSALPGVREPVEVVEVVETRDRVGFSYRTRPGHPVEGEEAFVVHRAGEQVRLTIRSLTRPAPGGPWRPLFPLLLVAQAVVRRRYLRALGGRGGTLAG